MTSEAGSSERSHPVLKSQSHFPQDSEGTWWVQSDGFLGKQWLTLFQTEPQNECQRSIKDYHILFGIGGSE